LYVFGYVPIRLRWETVLAFFVGGETSVVERSQPVLFGLSRVDVFAELSRGPLIIGLGNSAPGGR
jgi:hypothetical protein